MGGSRRVVTAVLAAVICVDLGAAAATVGLRAGSAPDRTRAVPAAARRGLATLAALPGAGGDRLLGVATFGPEGIRGAARALPGLRALGLGVLPLRKLPLVLVAGTRPQLEAAVRRGLAADVYPDERLVYFSAGSTAAIRADRLRAEGLTGKGVGVAIVDTGVDATHPDLADHVTHNRKLVGPEHLDALGGKHPPHQPVDTLVVPADALPYSNSDTTSGHGTHVAGIVAADAHTGPDQIGVAPDADIIGYGTGDALQIFTVLAAFDDVLAHREAWGIRVVNNSWGSSGRMFDPDHPINVATRTLHDAGVVVVLAAGNDGAEGTINPYSVAPWVISTASASVAGEPSDFSSGGYEHDNSLPSPVPADRHLHFEGDRVGIYHPDVTAPGSDITSSGTPTGVGVASPAPPGGTATLSGTSMAAPHVAGVAALLLQARPSLTPDQVRRVLQVTAAPPAGGSPFWKSGYGFVDASAAVDLVRRGDFGPALLDRLQAAADARVQGARAFRVRSSDLWSFDAVAVSVAGSDTRTFGSEVGPGTKAVRVVVSYPSLGLVGANPFDWQATLLDAAGRPVATTTPSPSAGVSSLFVDLTGREGLEFGSWTVRVEGLLTAADTDALLGNSVTVALAQLEPQAPAAATGVTFVGTGSRVLYFQPTAPAAPGDPAGPLPLALPAVPSPEGCALLPGPPRGGLGPARVTDACASGLVGAAVTHVLDTPAEFSAAAPLDHPVTFGGGAALTLWLGDAAAPAWTAAAVSRIGYVLDAVDGTGAVRPLAAADLARRVGPAEVGITPTRAEYGFEVAPVTVPAGFRLRLRLRFSGAATATMRLYYGGPYADAGLVVGTGRPIG